MNSPAVKDAERVIEMPAESFSRKEQRGLPVVQPDAATPMAMLAVAVKQGMSIETIRELRALQTEWEADEARKAFNAAFSAFKAEAVKIIKNRAVDAGPLTGKKYAELFQVVNAITPALSKHGLGAAWKLTKDEKDWIEVTCTLKHVLGHSDSVSMGGPPDTGGAKSPIQARASTVSYLERYTLKAICGVSEQGDDNDGTEKKAGMPEDQYAEFVKRIEAQTTKLKAKEIYTEAVKICNDLKDVESHRKLKDVLLKHAEFIDSANKGAK